MINNYNYGHFIKECIDSVLTQTYKNIEVVIVDDGSTDDSVEVMQRAYSNYDNIKIISKENGGQLSAFDEGQRHVTGDIVFFLDSDDLYKDNYIESVIEIYTEKKEVDFVYTALERFFPDGHSEITQQNIKSSHVVGFSFLSTLYTKELIGSWTSSLSMKRDVLNKILPIPFHNEWITRADDCLVWGASLVGANKYYCSKPLVMYRVHSSNNYFNKEFSNYYLFKRALTVNRLFSYLLSNNGIDERSKKLINLIDIEYASRTDKDKKLLLRYIKVLLHSKVNVMTFCKKLWNLLKIHFRQ